MNNLTNITKYKYLAPIYDLIFGKVLFNARKRAIDMLAIEQGQKILLVGVGTGQDLPLLPKDCFVTGIDISDAMLSKAQAKIHNNNVKLLKMNAEDIKFDNESFDIVILNLILSVVENPKKVMLEALRVLNKSGKVLIFDKFVESNSGVSFIRKLLNKITSLIGTDINRCFEDIIAEIPIQIIKKESSMFKGNYKIILLEKKMNKCT